MTGKKLDFKLLIARLNRAEEDLLSRDMIKEAGAVDRAVGILQMLHQWNDAYPEHIFKPVKNWEFVHEVLKKHGLSGDAIAADCMRHVTNGIKKAIEGKR